MNKIIIETNNLTIEDNDARKEIMKLQTKIDTLNDRTKIHTLQIKELERGLK